MNFSGIVRVRSVAVHTEFQLPEPCLECVVVLQRGYGMKFVKSPDLQALNWQKLRSFKAGCQSQKQPVVTWWLSQACRVGGARLGLFLLQDTELSLWVCEEQRCYGVTMFLWFPCLVAIPGQPQQLSPALFLCSGDWSLLPSWAECRSPVCSMFEKYGENSFLLWNPSLRTGGLAVPGVIDPYYNYLLVLRACRRSSLKFHLLWQHQSVGWAAAVRKWQASV